MRVAGYIRVSSDEQAKEGNSLFEQRQTIQTYCRSAKWDEPVFYEDDGYSAKDLNRPYLTRLLEDIKLRKYDVVLVTKLDRLSRKLIDTLTLVEYFDKYGCNFVSESEKLLDTTTYTGRMMLQLLGTFAEFERERIRERVRDNLLSLAKQGKLYGKPAYGYNVINGSYEVNIEESLIVKNIFQWTLEGKGTLWIAGHLNALGIPTKNNSQWNERRLREMLSLETYIGKFIYNRKYRKGTVEVTRPESEWIVSEDHHEPIIEIEVFNKVQSLLNNRKNASRKHHSDDRYLLSGLVVCAHCGHKMNGREVSRPKNKIKHQYLYLCSGYIKKGMCFYHAIGRDELEQIVIQSVGNLANGSADQIKRITMQEPEKKLSERDLIVSKLNKLDQRMQKQIEAYEMDLISAEDLKKARHRIADERITLQLAIEEYDKASEVSEQMKVQNKARNLLDDVMSEDRLIAKQAIAQIIHKIQITNREHVDIVWRG